MSVYYIFFFLCISYSYWALPSTLKRWYTDVRFDLFFYLSMNCMLVTIGTEFFQFQSTGCVVSILLSNISGNTPRFFINILSDTTSTFQNNTYSDIFTLGHEPPFLLIFDSSNSFLLDPKRRERNKIEIANSKYTLKEFVAVIGNRI